MTLTCKTCLKLPICKYKQEIVCKDLVRWLLDDTTHERLVYFEKWWGKDLSVLTASGSLKFKEREDQYACLIAKNM